MGPPVAATGGGRLPVAARRATGCAPPEALVSSAHPDPRPRPSTSREQHALNEFLKLTEAGILTFTQGKAQRAHTPIPYQPVQLVPTQEDIKAEIRRLYLELDHWWKMQATR